VKKAVSKLYHLVKRRRLIYRTQSSSQIIRITDYGNCRYLQFGEGKTPVQSCINLKDPDRIMMGCNAMMLSALFLNPKPRSILIIGLGGGVLSRTLAKIRPDAKIISVECDLEIAEIAKFYFYFKPTSNQEIIIDKGRNFINSALAQNTKFDLIMLDAFGTNYIPLDLMTLECLESIRSLLSPRGVLASNTFSTSSHYDQESVTYATVFGKFYQLKHFNRIILAQKNILTPYDQIMENEKDLSKDFKKLDINVKYLGRLFKTDPDWRLDAEPILDC
jgi:spermidine synthase